MANIMKLGPKNRDEELIFAEEEFRVHVQHSLQSLLNEKKLSHSQLAERLNVSEARVSQIFSSQCNLTLRMLGRVFYVLGERARLTWDSLTASEGRGQFSPVDWHGQWAQLEMKSEKRACSSVYEERRVPDGIPKSAAKVA